MSCRHSWAAAPVAPSTKVGPGIGAPGPERHSQEMKEIHVCSLFCVLGCQLGAMPVLTQPPHPLVTARSHLHIHW